MRPRTPTFFTTRDGSDAARLELLSTVPAGLAPTVHRRSAQCCRTAREYASSGYGREQGQRDYCGSDDRECKYCPADNV